jgi:DNA-binding GntR family transcriptional regulator
MCSALLADPVQTPRSMAEQVYDLLRTRIINQDLLPGERLLEVAVSASLNVSRTPVREAFRLLQQDDLVERIPQGGVKVTDLPVDELKEILVLRKILEVYAIELAIERITRDEISRLETIVAAAEDIVIAESKGEKIDLAELSRLNTTFHDLICNCARSSYLNKTLEIVRLPILRFRPFSLEDKKHRWRGVEEHKQMIAMLKSGDADGLKALTAKHVDDVSEAVERILASKKRKN